MFYEIFIILYDRDGIKFVINVNYLIYQNQNCFVTTDNVVTTCVYLFKILNAYRLNEIVRRKLTETFLFSIKLVLFTSTRNRNFFRMRNSDRGCSFVHF